MGLEIVDEEEKGASSIQFFIEPRGDSPVRFVSAVVPMLARVVFLPMGISSILSNPCMRFVVDVFSQGLL